MKEKQENQKKTIHAKKKEPTLFDDIEIVIEKASKSGLSETFYKNVSANTRRIARKLELSETQAVLLSFFINNSDDNDIRLHELGKFLGCEKIKILRMMDDIDELEKRRLIRCARKGRSTSYRVPKDVINAIRHNEKYVPPSHKNLSLPILFDVVEDLFQQRENNELSEENLLLSLDELFEDNAHLAFVKIISSHRKEIAGETDYLLLLCFCHLYVNDQDDNIQLHQFDDLFESKNLYRHICRSLQKGENVLQELKLIENNFDDGFVNTNSFRLTDKAKKKLFMELEIGKKKSSKKGLLLNENIVKKHLFYRDKERQQIEELASLLQPARFLEVQSRLAEIGMRNGFACLFYGSPGTGKTETVYQLARQTGRDVMMVDIAKSKSMWYGESQKIIKEIFESYRNFIEHLEVAPILLFNEADAIISKRLEQRGSSVDQTENAIQNIILQEMENLSGIMIATTNLASGMDTAFERRFLYRIEFSRPTLEAKQSIWQSLLPTLNETIAHEMAKAYDFSGGQIENIARRHAIHTILNGEEPPVQILHGFCCDEQSGQTTPRRIGF